MIPADVWVCCSIITFRTDGRHQTAVMPFLVRAESWEEAHAKAGRVATEHARRHQGGTVFRFTVNRSSGEMTVIEPGEPWPLGASQVPAADPQAAPPA